MKQILLTCDTEVGELAGDRSGAFEIFVEGKVEGQEVGFRLINNLASHYGAVVEHFVDIYPFQRYSETKFRGLCEEILASGHRIGLHTHPSGRYDSNRKFMYQYSLGEQESIIAFGKEKIYEWTEQEVATHRCGGYGADRNTLKALRANGILVDSSYFKDHPNCRYQPNVMNACFYDEGVFEVSVSVFCKKTRYKPLTLRHSNLAKLDFRYSARVGEILQAINQAPEEAVIVLFLHSFNFLNLPYNFKKRCYGKITVNHWLIHEYEALLSAIAQMQGCEFSTFGGIDITKTYKEYLVTIESVEPIWRLIKNEFLEKLGKRGAV